MTGTRPVTEALLRCLTAADSAQGASSFGWALIDPFFGEPTARALAHLPSSGASANELIELRCKAWGGREIHVCDDPLVLLPRHQLPYLVALESASDPLLAELANEAVWEHEQALEGQHAAYRMGGILQADLTGLQVMQRLQTMWRLPGFASRASGHRFLRIGDRRVMQWCTKVLGLQRVRTWLGPIDAWHFLNHNFEWITLHGEQIETEAEEQALFVRHRLRAERLLSNARLSVGREQMIMFKGSEAVSRALTKWQSVLENRRLSDAALDAAWGAVQSAHRAGFTEPLDAAEWAWRASVYPWRVDSKPWTAAAAKAKQSNTPLAAAFDELGESFWKTAPPLTA